jgi:hypothetical protein
MAALSDVSLHLAQSPPSDPRVFGRSAEYAQEVFLSLMPRLLVDGRSKLNIFIGKPGRNHGEYEPLEKRFGSFSEYYVSALDWSAFVTLSDGDKHTKILDIIESALVDICAKNGVSSSPFVEVAAQTRLVGLQYEREIRQLSKLTPSRKSRMSVKRTVMLGGESWRLDVQDRDKHVLHSISIAENINSVVSRYEFRRAVWNGDRFELLDFQQRPVFSVAESGQLLLPFFPARYSAEVVGQRNAG